MVYITPDGRVLKNKPWSFGSIVGIFWGAVEFVTLFFSSLFGLTNRGSIQNGRSRGSGGPGGPGNGPGGPRRRGEIKTMEDIQDCSMPGGG